MPKESLGPLAQASKICTVLYQKLPKLMLSAQQRIIFYFILLSMGLLGGGTFAVLQWVYPFSSYENSNSHFNRQMIFLSMIVLYLLLGLLLSFWGRKQAFTGGERKGFIQGGWMVLCLSVVAIVWLLFYF